MFQNQIGVSPYGVGMNQFSQGMNWIDNAQEVEKIELPPGADIVIFNRNKDELYIRSRDRYGYYKNRTYELKDITPEERQDKYITRDEFESILQKYLGGMRNDTLPVNEQSAISNATIEPDATYQSSGSGKRKADGSDVTIIK